MQESNSRSHLKKLAPEFYQGPTSYVHWTMAIDNRGKGWLDDLMHSRVRECLMHSLVKAHLVCPIYMLMSDHGHFLFVGYDALSDHMRAVAHFRRQWNQLLKPEFKLQHQSYDNVLREKDRERSAFQSIACYISQNPVRAGIVSDAVDYPYMGSVFPGRPQMDPRKDDFWNGFWLGYGRLCEGE